MDAEDLEKGDGIWSLDGDYGTVEKVVVLEDVFQPMYNLTVDEAHTYFIADGDWLVHNARCPVPSTQDFEQHVENRQNGDDWYDSRSFETGVTGQYTPQSSDTDMRGSSKTYADALNQAFDNTGYDKSDFRITSWATDHRTGKRIPVEFEGPDGSQVSMDYPHLTPRYGPDVPHVGWQVGKGSSRKKGHIFLDWVPAGRPPIGMSQ